VGLAGRDLRVSADRGAAPTGPGAAYGGAMRRTLLLTNDFPPRPGGIQSFLHTLSLRLPAEDLMVYAPRWRGDSHLRFDAAQPYPVVRHPTTLMLPTPAVARRAARLVREHRIETVWFGAAAPLALLGPTLRRAGASRIVATTHGHEVGWSMLPLARRALRRIGDDADVITFVSRYTRGRFAAAFGPQGRLEYLPPGVDPTRFRPDPHARAMLRTRYRIGDAPTVVCLSRLVPRKGQDQLIRALPRIRSRVPGAKLVIVGGGTDAERLARLAAASPEAEHIVLTGGGRGPGDRPARRDRLRGLRSRHRRDRRPDHRAAGRPGARPADGRGGPAVGRSALALGRDGRPAGHPALTPGGRGAGRPGAPVGRRAAGRHRGKVPPRRASAVPLYRLYSASISSA